MENSGERFLLILLPLECDGVGINGWKIDFHSSELRGSTSNVKISRRSH